MLSYMFKVWVFKQQIKAVQNTFPTKNPIFAIFSEFHKGKFFREQANMAAPKSIKDYFGKQLHYKKMLLGCGRQKSLPWCLEDLFPTGDPVKVQKSPERRRGKPSVQSGRQRRVINCSDLFEDVLGPETVSRPTYLCLCPFSHFFMLCVLVFQPVSSWSTHREPFCCFGPA